MSTEQPGSSFGIVKNAVTINIPRGMAIDFGLIPPTARERASREQEAAKWRDYAARQKQADEDMTAALHAKGDAVTRAMIDLHKPRRESDFPECDGCDFSGYEGEPPEWPCRTVIALANAHGISTREDVTR